MAYEIETALEEVLAHIRGEVALPRRIVGDPTADGIVALRKRLKLSRRRFADRFGLDMRVLQEWEQGRRFPDGAPRLQLTVIDHDPDSVARAARCTENRPRGGSPCVIEYVAAAAQFSALATRAHIGMSVRRGAIDSTPNRCA